MIDWFAWLLIGLATLAGLLGIVMGLIGRLPSDLTIGSLALVELFLLAQIAVAIVAPLAGNRPTGSPLEFWLYLICAALIPPAAGFWALVERNRWSNIVLGIAGLSIAVMAYRMLQIWTVQSI